MIAIFSGVPIRKQALLYKEFAIYQQAKDFRTYKIYTSPLGNGQENPSTDLPEVSPVHQKLVAPWVCPA